MSTSGQALSSVRIETESYEWADDGSTVALAPQSEANFGPFNVVARDRVELNGSIESDTPTQFAAMLRAFPTIRQIDMVDCPGTGDDEANLALARMVRKAGIATFVPNNGSVRSGGVELFLAGAKRSAAPNAEFAVHSWLDEDGMEPDDYADSDPVNREYLNYYREMGMSYEKAKAFYAMTNSVPHNDALYLKPRDIAAFIPLD
jgi:ATP-dependent protease ClpP protease subunit